LSLVSEKYQHKQFQIEKNEQNENEQILTDFEVKVMKVLENDIIVTNGKESEIVLWDIKRKKVIRKLEGHSSNVTGLTVLQNGLIASGSQNGEIKIWNPNEEIELKSLKGHPKKSVRILECLPNGFIVSASEDSTIRIWNPNQTEEWKIIEQEAGQITALKILKSGQILTALQMKKESAIKMINILNETSYKWNPLNGTHKILKGHTGSIRLLVVLPDGYLASGSFDKTIRIWNPLNGTLHKILEEHESVISSF
jgi:WD40 repeat protein